MESSTACAWVGGLFCAVVPDRWAARWGHVMLLDPALRDCDRMPRGSPCPRAPPPPPAAPPTQPPLHLDAFAVAGPVPPHTLPLDATLAGSAPQPDLPPLDATQAAFLEVLAGAPLRPMQAAAHIPREELAAVAATGAAEAVNRSAVADSVCSSRLAGEGHQDVAATRARYSSSSPLYRV